MDNVFILKQLKRISSLSIAEKEELREKLEFQVKARPLDYRPQLILAIYYISIEDYSHAIKHLKDLSVKKPGDSDVWYLLYSVYEKLDLEKNALISLYHSYRLGSERAMKDLEELCLKKIKKAKKDEEGHKWKKFLETIC